MKRKILTSSRKLDHIRICCEESVETGCSGFDDIILVHDALPECDMDTIDTSTRFLNTGLRSPLFIAAMTGGHPDTLEINRRLARAAERYGIGMGVGSQRAALEDPELEGSFTVVRDEAPHAFLCANLGVVQLRDHGIEWAERAVEMIDAQAICIHLNFLQEAIQPEGDHNAVGCLQAVQEICKEFRYPVIVKETGCGISADAALRIWGAGAAAIDIGGLGGTSWAAVECCRTDDRRLTSLGEHFRDWGIPTAVSLCEAAVSGGPVIATGGLRSGSDVAKAIALGATLGGMALPFLKPAIKGEDALFEVIEDTLWQLRVAMFLTGSGSIQKLQNTRTYITGKTRDMTDKNWSK